MVLCECSELSVILLYPQHERVKRHEPIKNNIQKLTLTVLKMIAISVEK